MANCCEKIHQDDCAAYWHRRQRDEVAKRVDLEKKLNALQIAHEVRIAEKNEQIMNILHSWALETDKAVEKIKIVFEKLHAINV